MSRGSAVGLVLGIYVGVICGDGVFAKGDVRPEIYWAHALLQRDIMRAPHHKTLLC